DARTSTGTPLTSSLPTSPADKQAAGATAPVPALGDTLGPGLGRRDMGHSHPRAVRPSRRITAPEEAVARIQLWAAAPQHVGCRPATTSTCCGAATPNPIRATSSERAIWVRE